MIGCLVATHPVLSRDCEVLLWNGLTDNQKLDLVLHFSNHNPSSSFKFPTTIAYGKHGSFQYLFGVLQVAYKWLGYSVKLDTCLCLSCSLFGEAGDAQNFVHKPVSNWTTFNNKVQGDSSLNKPHTHQVCISNGQLHRGSVRQLAYD